MFGKLIRSVTGDADKRTQDAQDVAAAALRKLGVAQNVPEPEPVDPFPPLRGSGSWDTDYTPAQSMAPLPHGTPAAPASQHQPARVAIYPMRLMTPAHLALFEQLTDHLEQEAPAMTVHAQVAMDAFLHVDGRAPQTDQDAARAGFRQERVDLLILDEGGIPVVAVEMVGNGRGAGTRAAAKVAAMEEAGMGVVTVNELTPPADVWLQVLAHLDLDDDEDEPRAAAL